MCQYYYDEVHGVAYKIDPILVTEVQSTDSVKPKGILVQTDVKVTNNRREKVRRTISEVFPHERCDAETARQQFCNSLHLKLTRVAARKISEAEYMSIKSHFEYQ